MTSCRSAAGFAIALIVVGVSEGWAAEKLR
jgi:hypothetical protein